MGICNEVCPKGKWSNQAAQTSAMNCKQCSAGKYSDQTARTSEDQCKLCLSGKWSSQLGLSSETQCQLCSAGRWSSVTGLTQDKDCLGCSPGRSSSESGQNSSHSCTACPRGLYSDESGTPSCKYCAAGKGYRNATSCDTCRGGWYQSSESTFSANCTKCEAGKYNADQGATRFADKHRTCDRCPDGLISEEGKTFCVGCPIGWTPTGIQSEPCVECPSGSKGIQDEQTFKCEKCDQGQYQKEKGQPFCLPCLPGTTQHQKGQPLCNACKLGRYMATAFANDIKCFDCSQGQYQDELSQANCKACVAGRWSNKTKLNDVTECQNCSAGTYSSATGIKSSDSCNSCSVGKYGTDPGAISSDPGCTSCPKGWFQNASGTTSCHSCKGTLGAGFGNKGLANTGCVGVPPGSYQDEAGIQRECEPGYKCLGGGHKRQSCPPGSYASLIESVNCIECPPGQAADKWATSECVDCLPGKFREGSDKQAEICHDCARGLHQPEHGQTICAGCDLGKYGDSPGKCSRCPAGEYNDRRGSTKCFPCAVGKVPNVLHTACERPAWTLPGDCEPKVQYLNDQSDSKEEWTCEPCPNGVDCSLPSSFSTLSMQATGFWNATWEEVQPSFHACPRPGNCRATNDSNASPCLANSDGPLCAVCLPNHYVEASTGACQQCSTTSQSAKAGVLATLVCFLLFCYLLYRQCRHRIRRLRAKAEKQRIVTPQPWNLASITAEMR